MPRGELNLASMLPRTLPQPSMVTRQVYMETLGWGLCSMLVYSESIP